MSLISEASLNRLEHELKLVLLINRRNKNQHRVALWWKHLNILKRKLNSLVLLLMNYQDKPTTKSRNQILEVARYLKFIAMKKCYWAFNNIIALGQFIPLGLMLIGILGRINSDLDQIDGINEQKPINEDVLKKNFELVNDTADIGEEIGEVIIEDMKVEEIKTVKDIKTLDLKSKGFESPTNLFGVEKKKRKKEKSNYSDDKGPLKKKSKKKKKSAIDDIFG